ncbi:sugar ABC transporter permease [Bacillus sp. F19]|nr:sugar ABC transporter permease [Bacillus sp. F19]
MDADNRVETKFEDKIKIPGNSFLSSLFTYLKYTVNSLAKNPYILIAPALLLALVFTFYPVFFAIYNSFFKWDIITGEKGFIGLQNYYSLFTDITFMIVIKNTFIYTLFTVVFGLIFSLLIGIFLNKKSPVVDAVQTVVFTPHIISFVSVSVLWMLLLDPQTGLVNFLLEKVGLEPQLWMMSEKTSLLSIIIVSIWKGLGYTVLMVIAGLQSIPREIYEAARLDKANSFKTLIHITIPLISPTLFFLFITSMIGSFSSFDIVNLMTEGGPNHSSNLLVHWIYETGFLNFRIGPAMAASVLFLIIIGFISFVNFKLFGKKVHY